MNRLTVLLPILILLTACGRIDSEHGGVRTSFTGNVNPDELSQGFYTAVLSSVEEYSCKELVVEAFDMRPKARDNLTMNDLDLEIYYKAACDQLAELKLKYTGRDQFTTDDLGYPAYKLVRSMARETAYAEVSKYDSLEIHKNREKLGEQIKAALQNRLNNDDPGVFTITRVVVRSAVTDPSIEQSITLAVSKNKELEARKKEVEIAEQQALAYRKLNKELTMKVLRNKELDITDRAITEGAKPYVLFGMSDAQPLLQMPNQ